MTDADAYFAGRLGSTLWTAASTLTKQQALITSARWLDVQNWGGTRTVAAQANAFPRDSLTCKGVAFLPASIPSAIVFGEYEAALMLLGDPSLALLSSTGTGSNIKSLKAGSVAIDYFAPTILIAGLSTPLPKIIMDLVGCFLASAGSGAAAAYGTGADSLFDDCGRFGLTKGFA